MLTEGNAKADEAEGGGIGRATTKEAPAPGVEARHRDAVHLPTWGPFGPNTLVTAPTAQIWFRLAFVDGIATIEIARKSGIAARAEYFAVGSDTPGGHGR